MKMPQEFEVWYIIPAVRKGLAEVMLRKGLKQKDIAQKLGVTEAAISQYMKSKRAKGVKLGKDVSREIESSAGRIIKGGDSLREMHRLTELCRKGKVLCKVHRSKGKVPKECRICLE
jgi:predicted transcriptional regulator